jgi:uncharacterized repeat protein (TIGR01451 family)
VSTTRRFLPGLTALLLALVWFIPGSIASAATVVPDTTINGCNGVLPTPGSENTHKRLDPNFPSDFNPGGVVGYIVDFPVDPSDVGGDFEITDCVYVDPPGAGADAPIAKYFVHFVPNSEDFHLQFSVPIPANTPLGSQFCNYAKTTASPSASQASNRKAGPACFTVGGGLRIEKRSGSASGPLLGGASFSVVCSPTVTSPPTIITGLSNQSQTNQNGTVSASGVSADGTVAINGPSGTPCTVTETAAPPGYVLDSTPRNLLIPVGTSQTVNVFVNEQLGSLSVSKHAVGGGGTFHFTVSCDDGETYAPFDMTVAAGDTDTHLVSDQIVVGTQCTVTESASALFSTTRLPNNGTVTIDADGETVAYTNTRLTGSLVVTKAADVDGTFQFDVDCDGTAYDTTLNITTSGGSGSASISGIPTGTSCTVTEQSNPLFSTVVTPGDGTVTIAVGDNTVAFTNTRLRGSLIVTKAITDGSNSGPYDFTYHVTCGEEQLADFHLGTAEGLSLQHQIDGIPTGTTCTVTEDADASWDVEVTPSDGSAVIGSEPVTVAFANTKLFTDVSLTKSSDPVSGTAVTDGDTITYTLSYANAGNTSADVTITDAIPDGTTYVDGSAGDGVLTDGTLAWARTIDGGGQGSVSFQVTVNAGLTDPFTIINVGALHEGETTTPTNQTEHPVAHLVITKSVDKETAEYGDSLTYKLHVSNPSAADQTGVVISDPMPDGATFVSASDGGTCNDPCTTVTWPAVDLAASSSLDRTFVVSIDTPAFDPAVGLQPETIVNVASVHSDQTPPQPSNEVRTTVVAVLGVKVVKPQAEEELPFTGPAVPIGAATWLAVSTIFAGALLVVGTRRRRGQAA